MIKVTRKPGKK